MHKTKNIGWMLLGVSVMSGIMSMFEQSCIMCDIERIIMLTSGVFILYGYINRAHFCLLTLALVGIYHMCVQFGVFNEPGWCQIQGRCSNIVSVMSVPLSFGVVALSLISVLCLKFINSN